MPDESCRKCGGILRVYSLCAKCRKTINHICIMCGIKSMELLHDHCFLSESHQSRRDMIEDAYAVPA